MPAAQRFKSVLIGFATTPGRGQAAHEAIVKATVLAEGPRTRDLGGKASTTEIGQAIAEPVAAA